ncbi:glycoside hydrolase family 18 protein [Granulicella sp. WH15]|uniref:glycoside hydrolase family 18 protein n=1 Tax=Granulicella sp. WH15 TaxID=2602070 RepID=UPI0013673DDD|nr:glycoside hydrolase family 18 protein [Granulicella sp. WH15]QHN03267.1 glycoside hydrolase family 18 protein [Granulicella sp. WH15]
MHLLPRILRYAAALALTTTPLLAQSPLLTGYFPQWGLYDQPQYLVKDLVTAHGASMLDQVNYAQGFVTNGRCSIADPNADLNYTFTAQQSVDGVADTPTQPLRGHLNQFVKLKRLYPHLKLVLSLEGRASDFAADAQPENRAAFVSSCVDLFLKGNLAPGVHVPGLFDGIDIDWEFPRDEDTANFIALLAEFRRQFDALRPGLLLNIAVGHSPRMAGATDGNMSAISALVDQVGLMTYDYTGGWSQTTGFLAPFSTSPDRPYGTVQRSIQAYLAAGVPASKLMVGVPFYGYGWRLVPEENNGLFQEGEPIRGDRPYRYIETLIPHSRVFREPDSQNPWLFDGDAFWTYDDPASVRHKADYATQQHLGGLMIWELGEDNATATLLESAYQGLHSTSTASAEPHQHPAATAPATTIR